MPTAVAAGEIVQVLHQYTLEGQECENVWYFQAEAADNDMLLHLLESIATCLLTTLIPHLSSTYTLERLKAKVVSPIIGPEEEWTPDGTDLVGGQEAGDSLPSHDSAVISLHTTRGGREGRGRSYIGGIPESQTLASRINPELDLWAALLAFCACMLATFHPHDVPAAGNYTWGVMSRKIGGSKPPFLNTGYAVITRAVPAQYLGTTRSRKVGRGR